MSVTYAPHLITQVGRLRAQSAAASPTADPSPPFTECAAVGDSASCGVLLDLVTTGTRIIADPNVGTFDGADDTLVGVVNNTGHAVSSLTLSSNSDIFNFDDDGLCTYGIPGCPFGSTGYEGPNTSFSNISADNLGGVVNFAGGLAPGATAYFSLEEQLTASSIVEGGPTTFEQGGAANPSERQTNCGGTAGDPVNCASGEFFHQFRDVSIPGDGVGLQVSRTYTSSLSGQDSLFGYGWSSDYGMHLSTDPGGDIAVSQENGSGVTFTALPDGSFTAPPRVLASLTDNGDGSLTFERNSDHVKFRFDRSSGRLLGETDRNGYPTTLTYAADGTLTGVSDPSGRRLAVTEQGGHVTAVTDPMGRTTHYAYDGAGDLSSTTDPLGRRWTFTYDVDHQLLTMTDPAGGTTTNTYDSSGHVTSQTDPLGHESTWSYTGDNSSAAGGTTTVVDWRGRKTVYSYIDLELVAVTHAADTSDAATTSYAYDPATLGRTTVTDPLGHVSTATYDTAGNQLTATDALGRTTTFSYNSFNEVTEQTTPLGDTTDFAYDDAGNLTSTSDALGNQTTVSYDDSAHPGDPTTITDPDGRVTTNTYDAAGNVVARTVSPASGVQDVTRYGYDADGERTCTVPPNATHAGLSCGTGTGVSRYQFDAAGQVVAVVDPNGHRTTYRYDADGRRTAATDATGATTTTGYDAGGRVTTVTRAAGTSLAAATRTTYDVAPRRGGCPSVAGAVDCTVTTSPGSRASTAVFGARGETLATSRGRQVTQTTYDVAGNRTTTRDALGRVTHYRYDAANELTGITYASGTHDVSYTYDADGRRASMTDGTGTTTYSYDSASRLIDVTDGGGHQVGYGYDGAGHVVALAYPIGQQVQQAYDGAGEMTAVTDWLGHTTNFSYDPDGNLTRIGYPNGDRVDASFDAADQVTAIVLSSTSSHAVLASIRYRRDAANAVTSERDSGALTGQDSYRYDALRRLVVDNSSSYRYDAAGNPLLLGTRAQAFNNGDELTRSSAAGVTTTYRYDGVGDRTSATGSTGASTRYQYDQASRLLSLTSVPAAPRPVVTGLRPNRGRTGQVVTLTGRGFTRASSVHVGAKAARFRVVSDRQLRLVVPSGKGRVDVTVATAGGGSGRVTADRFTYVSGSVRRGSLGTSRPPTVPGVTTTYAYNGDGLRVRTTSGGAETAFVWDASSGIPLVLTAGNVAYLYGPGGLPVEQISGSVANFMLADHQTSTRVITDLAGSVVGTSSYSPFGVLGQHKGARAALGYDGQYSDTGSGLQYLRARYYEPSSGGFLSLDPLVSMTGSAYGYSNDDPIDNSDPAGLDPVFSGIGAVVGSVAGAITGAGSYLYESEVLHTEGFTTGGLVANAVGGGVGGAIAGGCIGLTDGLATFACDAAGGAAGEATSEALNHYLEGGHVDVAKIGVAGLTGGVLGAWVPEVQPLKGFVPRKIWKNITDPGPNTIRSVWNALYGGAVEGGVDADLACYLDV